MKKTLLIGLLTLTAWVCHAQADNIVLSVRATLPFVNFVIGENVPLTVSLTNPGSSTFIIDDYPPHNQNSFHLFLRNAKGRIALPKTEASPLPRCTIKPGGTHTFTLNVNDYYDLGADGHYQVSVTVNRGRHAAHSRILPFAMARGIEIGRMRRIRSGSDAVALEYTLLYWARNEREYLFLRITELPSKRLHGFVTLGTVVRIADPQIHFEGEDTVVVTHQTSRDTFIQTRLDTSQSPVRILDSRPLTSAVAIQEDAMIRRAQQQIDRTDPEPAKPRGFLRRTRTPVP